MRLILCLVLILVVSPAHAARKRVKYPTPVVGKGTYTVTHPSVSSCKDGKCRIAR